MANMNLTEVARRYPANLGCPEQNASGLVFLETFTHARITGRDGSKRFVAGFDLTFMDVDPRDVEAERYSMQIIEDGRALLCKCPNLPWDYIENYDAIVDGKKQVSLHSSDDIEEEFSTKRLRLVADKSRHNHEFILDFHHSKVTLDEKQVRVLMQSFFENHLSKETELSPEPVPYEAEKGGGYKCNLVYKVAIDEEEPRLITETTPAKKVSGKEVMDRLRSKFKSTNF